MFVSSIGGFVGSLALNIGRTGFALTAGSSVISSGVYSFVFDASPIRGGIVGAQLGAALSYAYATGGWKNVGTIAGKGTEAGLNKMIAIGISRWSDGTLQQWTRTRMAQDFYEGFAAGAWSATYGQFLNEHTDVASDPIKQALSSLTFSIATSVTFSLPDLITGKRSPGQFYSEVVSNTVSSWFASNALDTALRDLAATPTARAALKSALVSLYTNAANALVDIFDFDVRKR